MAKQTETETETLDRLRPHSLTFGYSWLITLLIHITHWKKKYTRTAKAGGLNGLRSAKNDVKNLQE